MCGSNVQNQRLYAAGLLNSLGKSDWVSVAEEVADLSDADFATLIEGFRLY